MLVLCLPRDAGTAHVTRQVLDAALAALGVWAGTRADVGLALGEACANVVQHADPSDEYEVRARVIDSRCVIEVVDTGRGFDADVLAKAPIDPAASAEYGRGLQIINAVSENLRIANRRVHGAMLHFELPLRWEAEAVALSLVDDSAPPLSRQGGHAGNRHVWPQDAAAPAGVRRATDHPG